MVRPWHGVAWATLAGSVRNRSGLQLARGWPETNRRNLAVTLTTAQTDTNEAGSDQLS